MTAQSDDYKRRLERIESLLDDIEGKMEMVIRHEERFTSYLQGMSRMGERMDRHEMDNNRVLEEFRVRLREVESHIRVVYAISGIIGTLAMPVLANTILKWF